MGVWAVLGHWVVSSTVQTGLMAAILSLVGVVAGHYLSPRWQVGLRQLVLSRLYFVKWK